MIAGLIHLVIYIVVLGLVVGLLLWALDQAASVMPPPFYTVARIAIIVVAVLVLILLLLSMVGPLPRLL